MGRTDLQKSSLIGVLVVFAINLAVWTQTHTVYAKWAGVPPVPSENGAAGFSLGDKQFSYRFMALVLQNLGDTGGNVTPLLQYDYSHLSDWFDLLDGLDPKSTHVPMLAAYYFGGTSDPDQQKYIVDYLTEIGLRPLPGSWRWLARAVFLARFNMKDIELALRLAHKLAALPPDEKRPTWTKQMPAFVLTAMGKKEAARAIMEKIMETETGLHPNEYNFMRSYIEERLADDPDDDGNTTNDPGK